MTGSQLEQGTPKTATLLQGVKMVLSAFIGIRRRGNDGEKIEVKPVQVIITGIICAVVFVVSVKMVVRFVLH